MSRGKLAATALLTGLLLSLLARRPGVRGFIDSVREATAEREDELRLALGIDAGSVPEPPARRLIADPLAEDAGVDSV